MLQNIGLFEDKVLFGDFPKVRMWSLAERLCEGNNFFVYPAHEEHERGTSSKFTAEFFRL